MENKRIAVVTGANGFVGSHLVDLLIEKGFIVKCITRKSSNLKWLQGKNVEIFDCGLFDKEGLKKAFKGADYIFHVAGVVKSKKPEGYYKANVEATKNVLESAVEVKETIKKIVIVGSQTAAGPSLDGKPVIESLPVKPITTYGRSKAEQEKLAATFMDKLPISICRAPAIYGERDTEIFIFFKTFASGLMTTIGFDKKVISLIHVKDLVYGLYLSAIKNISAGQTYFVSSEKIYTWEEIGEVTSKVMNKKAFRVKVPHSVVYSIAAVAQFFAMFSSKAATLNIEKARDLTRKAWICSTEKAVKQLNYRQKISIEDGIKRTVDWYKKEGWLK
jgi:nucleoside-diphosphate-sugar epimerase